MLLHSDFFASDITPHLYLLFLSLLLFYYLIFPSYPYYISRSLIFLSISPTVRRSIRPFVCLSVFPSFLCTYSFLPSPFFLFALFPPSFSISLFSFSLLCRALFFLQTPHSLPHYFPFRRFAHSHLIFIIALQQNYIYRSVLQFCKLFITLISNE